MDFKTREIISDEHFIRQILLLKSKEEIKQKLSEKEAHLTEEEFNQYIQFILNCIDKLKDDDKMSEVDLEKISGGSFKGAVRGVGKVISFPFRSIAYGVGAVIASIPKGFADGVKDAWTEWENIK